MPVDEFKDYIDPACRGAPPLQADFSHITTTGVADEMCHNFVSSLSLPCTTDAHFSSIATGCGALWAVPRAQNVHSQGQGTVG